MNPSKHPVDVVTDDIIAWAYTDSLVDLKPRRAELRQVLVDDMAESEHRMTTGTGEPDSDTYLFVCGDIDNERRKELVKLYPRTDALRACLLAVQALRQLERCGASEILDRAFQGFSALPAQGETATSHWRTVLGFTPDEPVSRSYVTDAYRSLARQRHPDRGGSDEAMVELNRAHAEAMAELEVGHGG